MAPNVAPVLMRNDIVAPSDVRLFLELFLGGNMKAAFILWHMHLKHEVEHKTLFSVQRQAVACSENGIKFWC